MKLFSASRRRKEDARSDAALDQIAALTDANGRAPDPEAQRRLIRLRHQAYEDLDRGDPGPVPEPDDSAVEWVDGLPTCDGAPTAGALAAGMNAGGCLLVRGLVDEARIASLIDGIDRSFASRDADRKDEWFEPLAIGGGAYNLARQRQWVTSAGGVWAADSPRMTFELIELFGETGLLDVIGEYLGERPVASVNKWTLRRVSPGGDADWHQDGAFLGRDIRAMNVWLALTDCGRDAPGMDVVPRPLGDIIETGTEGARFDWSVSPRKVAELLDGDEPLRPSFKAGDMLLFDGLFLHQTANEDTMTRDRYAVETWCFGPSSFPDKQVPLVL